MSNWSCPKCHRRYRLKPGATPPAICPDCRKRGPDPGKVREISFETFMEDQSRPPTVDVLPVIRMDDGPPGPRRALSIVHRFGGSRLAFTIFGALIAGIALLSLAIWFLIPRGDGAAVLQAPREPTAEDLEAVTTKLIEPFIQARLSVKYDRPFTVEPLKRKSPAWSLRGRFDSQNAYGVYLQHKFRVEAMLVPKGEGRTTGPHADRDRDRPFVPFDDEREISVEFVEFDSEYVYQSPELRRAMEAAIHVLAVSNRRDSGNWELCDEFRMNGNVATKPFSTTEAGWRIRWKPTRLPGGETRVRFIVQDDAGRTIAEESERWPPAPVKGKRPKELVVYPRTTRGRFTLRVEVTPEDGKASWIVAVEE